MRPREVTIEHWIRLRLASWRPKLLYLKFGSSSSIGFPDRLLLWKNGGILFVEFKRPGEKPRRIQEVCHELLRGMGFTVQVHDDKVKAITEIMRYVEAHEERVRALGIPDEGDESHSFAKRNQDLFEAGWRQDGPDSKGV